MYSCAQNKQCNYFWGLSFEFGDLGNEFEEPLFMQNKNLMDAFMKASNGDRSFPSVGCRHLQQDCTVSCCLEEEARGEVPPEGPLSRSPAAGLSHSSPETTGCVHILRLETITGHGLAAAISSLLGT